MKVCEAFSLLSYSRNRNNRGKSPIWFHIFIKMIYFLFVSLAAVTCIFSPSCRFLDMLGFSSTNRVKFHTSSPHTANLCHITKQPRKETSVLFVKLIIILVFVVNPPPTSSIILRSPAGQRRHIKMVAIYVRKNVTNMKKTKTIRSTRKTLNLPIQVEHSYLFTVSHQPNCQNIKWNLFNKEKLYEIKS